MIREELVESRTFLEQLLDLAHGELGRLPPLVGHQRAHPKVPRDVAEDEVVAGYAWVRGVLAHGLHRPVGVPE